MKHRSLSDNRWHKFYLEYNMALLIFSDNVFFKGSIWSIVHTYLFFMYLFIFCFAMIQKKGKLSGGSKGLDCLLFSFFLWLWHVDEPGMTPEVSDSMCLLCFCIHVICHYILYELFIYLSMVEIIL